MSGKTRIDFVGTGRRDPIDQPEVPIVTKTFVDSQGANDSIRLSTSSPCMFR